MTAAAGWMRSGRCVGGECVEVRTDPDGVQVRASTAPDTVLRFGPAAWAVFLDDVKAGHLDRAEPTP